MIVGAQAKVDISAETIGGALVTCSPEDFNTIWFNFAGVEEDHLMLLAKRMANPCGGLRKEVLKKLVKLIEFHEQMGKGCYEYYEKD